MSASKRLSAMKKINIFLASIALVAAASCSDRLNIPQNGVLDESTYYKSDEDAAAAVAAAYASLAGGSSIFTFEHVYKNVNGYLSDEYWPGQVDRTNALCQLTSYTFDANDMYIEQYYSDLYSIIAKCNVVVDNIKGETAFQKQAVAEARTLRAWSYFELTTLWGTPALVEHVSGDQPGNATQAELWAFIEHDLSEAISSGAMSEKSSKYDRSNYRLTKQFAQAMLGKAYLWQGKNADAAKVLDEVIESELYGLFSGSYGDMYDIPNENNEEVMFATNKLKDTNNPSISYVPSFTGMSLYTRAALTMENPLDFPYFCFGGFSPRSDLYQAFVAEEGADGYRLNESIKTYEYMAAAGYPIIAGAMENSEGFFQWKGRFLNPQVEMYGIGYITDRDIVWMRYAEVLLMAAEANIGIDQTKADKYLNEVRHRAGLGDKTCTLEAIKTERRLELFGDFCRYKDLQRWGDAASVLATAGDKEPEFYSTGVEWKSDRSGSGYKIGKHEYLPIPAAELLINKNMNQTSSAWN